jgi:putative glutamine amidotransferase
VKPLIGITAGTIHSLEHPYAPFTYGQKHTYIEAISENGGIPVIIPITQNADEVKEIFERLDGILFAGGNDIGTQLYGQEPRDVEDDIDDLRDTHEVTLMKLALEAHKPILAICRGMQLLNVVRGGTLYQDIAKEVPGAKNHDGYMIVKNTKYLAHALDVESDSYLAKIIGDIKINANTHHHQAIRDLGHGLTVNARAEDGIIEGVEDMSEGYIVGVQAHPESIYSDVQQEWQPLFKTFIAASTKT